MEDRQEAEETNSEKSEKQPDSSDSTEEGIRKKRWPWILLCLYIPICIALSYGFRDQLRGDDSLAETLRNLGVVYGALAGLFIAVWRSTSADEQAAATKAQGEAAAKQADAAGKEADAADAALVANKAREQQIAAQNEIAKQHADAAVDQITASKEIATKQNDIAKQHADAAVDQVTASKEIAADRNTIAERRAQAAEDQITASREIAADRNTIAERRAQAAEDQLAVSRETADQRVAAAKAQEGAAKAQVEATKEQTETARQYGEAAREGVQDARYRRGVEALGHDEMSIRLAGVYELEALFHENYDKFGLRVIRLLCAFARNPPRLARMEMYPPLREDVQEVVAFLGSKVHETLQAIDQDQKCEIDLRGAVLPYADMRETDMSDVDFGEAILILADFSRATLTGAKFVMRIFLVPI